MNSTQKRFTNGYTNSTKNEKPKMPNSIPNLEPEALEPIIADRSTLERVANCPHSQYLYDLIQAIGDEINGVATFTDRAFRLIKGAPESLAAHITALIKGGRDLLAVQDALPTCGTIIHKLIEEAFEFCKGDLEQIPDYFAEELPKVRPDLQPEIIRAGRYVAIALADLHVRVISVEQQIDHILIPEVPGTRGAVVGTTCIDLLAQGLNNSLHVIDWKTGWKKRSNSEAFNSFQAQFIAWLLWQQEEYAEVEKIHFWFYETRRDTKAYAKFDRNDEHPALPHLTQELAFQARIMTALRLWQTGCTDAWPEETKCCWCDVIQFCKHANTRAIDITKDPTAFVDRMIVLKQLLTKDKKTATAYIKKYGTVVGTVGVFEQTPPSTKFLTQIRKRKDGETNIETEIETTD